MPRRRYAPESVHAFRLSRTVGPRPMLPYLRARLGLPENLVRRLIRQGAVRVESAVVDDPENVVDWQAGTCCEVRFPADWPPHLQPTPMNLRILYEDAYLVALDKPPRQIVHPARGYMNGGTLQNGLLYRYRNQRDNAGFRVAPAHRLDRDTSGVIVFARTRGAYRALVACFAARETEKTYWALVHGVPDWAEAVVDAPIGLDPQEPKRCAIVPAADGGKNARTALKAVEAGGGWAWVEARPLTGRPHQVRVHLVHAGHPVLGDRDYHPAATHPIDRQALHAARLVLAHPITGETLELTAPLPPDMAELLARLRQSRVDEA